MVIMELAAGSATSSAALGMFRYNRDGWMTDVQVNQNRRYQRQQVRLSQAEMFREDIRDLVGASVAKQNNFVLIATLILGMIGECYIEGPLPDGAAEFVSSVYMLCVGSSLLYLVLSVICAITATTLASNCQKDLLTTLVRLPVNEFVAEIDDAAPRETVEAFEHQSFKKILRPPVWSRLMGGQPVPADHNYEQKVQEESKLRPPPSAPSTQSDVLRRCFCPGIAWNPHDPSMRDDRSRSSVISSSSGKPRPSVHSDGVSSAATEHGSESDFRSITTGESGLGADSIGPVGLAEPQETKAERHLDVFHDKEKDWIVMGKCAFLFGGMGASHLLQAYGYFSAGRFYSGSNWASWVVQFIVVFVNAILVQASMSSHPLAGIVGFVLNVIAPAAATLAMRVGNPPWVDPLCVPLCFCCHLLWNVIGLALLAKLVFLGEKSKSMQDKTFTDASEPHHPGCEEHEGRACQNEAHKAPRRFDERRQRFFLVLLGNSVIIVAWFITLVWAVTHAVSGTGDNGMVISAKRRLTGIEVGSPTSLNFQTIPSSIEDEETSRAASSFNSSEVPVTWPHPRFRPHSIACGSSQTCFAVNDFLVVGMTLDGSDVNSTRILDCSLPAGAAILDVTANCPTSNAEEKPAVAQASDSSSSSMSSRALAVQDTCEPVLLLKAAGGGTSVATCSPQGTKQLSLDSRDPVWRIAMMRDDDFGLLTVQGSRVLQHAATTSGAAAASTTSQPTAATETATQQHPSSSSSPSSSSLSSPAHKSLSLISGWRSLWPIAAAREDRVVSMDVASGDTSNLLLFSPRGLLDVVDPDSGKICQSMKWSLNPTEIVAGAAAVPQTSSVLVIHHLTQSEGSFASEARLLRIELPDDFSKCARTRSEAPGASEDSRQATPALRGRLPAAH